MDFHLYRIKVFSDPQKDIFRLEQSAPDILRAAILDRPVGRSHLGVEWHIGNVEEFGSTKIYFALGRAAKARLPVRRADTGDFEEADFEAAPYTHVFVDTPTEVCAIARKTNLAPDTDAIARRLEGLLNSSTAARHANSRFSVSAIRQPDDFLQELGEAYAIKAFTVHFTRPNPIDVDADYLRPMERLTEQANGTKGATTIKGAALNPEPLAELTRSAASTGDNASARLKLTPDSKTVTRSLKGATATLTVDAIESREDKVGFFDRIREKYLRMRGAITGETA